MECDLLLQGEILPAQIAPGLRDCFSYPKQGRAEPENPQAGPALDSRFGNDFILEEHIGQLQENHLYLSE